MVLYGGKRSRLFVTWGVLALLLAGTFGLSHFGMMMPTDGIMATANCPFMNGAGICTMSPLEHVALWQSIFTNMAGERGVTILLVLLLMATARAFAGTRYSHSPPKDLHNRLTYYTRRRYVPAVPVLRELFSSGILNPKLF